MQKYWSIFGFFKGHWVIFVHLGRGSITGQKKDMSNNDMYFFDVSKNDVSFVDMSILDEVKKWYIPDYKDIYEFDVCYNHRKF